MLVLLFLANEPAKECSVTDCVETHRERSLDPGSTEDNIETGSGNKCLNLDEKSADAIGGSSSFSSGATAAIVSFVSVAVLAAIVGAAS